MRTLLPLLCDPMDFLRLNAGLAVAFAVVLVCIVALVGESVALLIAARRGMLRPSLLAAAPMVLALLFDPLAWQVWSRRYFPPACISVAPARWNALVDAYTHAAIVLEIGTGLAVALTIAALVIGFKLIARSRADRIRAAVAL